MQNQKNRLRVQVAGVMKEAPCKKCPHRTIGCHAECERYKAWVEEREAEKEELRRKKREYHAVATYMKEARERAKK